MIPAKPSVINDPLNHVVNGGCNKPKKAKIETIHGNAFVNRVINIQLKIINVEL